MQETERDVSRVTTAPVAVLEVDPTGHRLRYVRHLCDAAGADDPVVLVPAQARGSEEYRTHLADAAARTVELAGTARSDLLAEALDRAAELGARRLVIPDGDHYVLPLLRLLVRRARSGRARPSTEIRLLLMRSSTVGGPEPLRPAMVIKPLAVALLRRFPGVRVHLLTDAWGVVHRRRGYPNVVAVRDPVPPEPSPTVPVDWVPAGTAGRIRVGVFGVISPRKNLALLLEAAVADAGLVVVVGGSVWAAVADHLASDPGAATLRAQGRLVVTDRMLGAGELAAALGAVDVVAILHDNDAPSGVLAQACQAATPTVVPAGAWLERVVSATGIGRATALTPDEVAAAVRAAHLGRGEHVAAAGRAAAQLGTEHFTTTLLADS